MEAKIDIVDFSIILKSEIRIHGGSLPIYRRPGLLDRRKHSLYLLPEIRLAQGLVALGELGLSGEIRAVPQLERRIAEAARLGFERCLIPDTSAKPSSAAKGIELLTAGTVAQALRLGLVRAPRKSEHSGEEPHA